MMCAASRVPPKRLGSRIAVMMLPRTSANQTTAPTPPPPALFSRCVRDWYTDQSWLLASVLRSICQSPSTFAAATAWRIWSSCVQPVAGIAPPSARRGHSCCSTVCE